MLTVPERGGGLLTYSFRMKLTLEGGCYGVGFCVVLLGDKWLPEVFAIQLMPGGVIQGCSSIA